MSYKILRTAKADELLHGIVLYIQRAFDTETALKKLDEIEAEISNLEENPYLGVEPRYRVLKRQGYRVLILKKNLVFYKVHEDEKIIMIHAIVDDRMDYLSIVMGL